MQESLVTQQTSISPDFIKRTGTNKGKDYEVIFIADRILKLLKDAHIEDFYISSNDSEFGSFDDMVLEVIYCNTTKIDTYALQLKHKDNNDFTIKDLRAKKGNFSIREYYQDCSNHSKLLDGSVKTILFTNCPLQKKSDKFQVFLTNETANIVPADIEIEASKPNDLINTSSKGEWYKLNSDPKYNNFFEKFFLYTGQLNLENLRMRCLNEFQSMFHCDESVFNDYLNFLTQWSMIEGKKEKLTKSWIKRVIALQVLSPFIKPLSFKFGSKLEQKRKILQNRNFM
ncbi:uncharacterized protein LOC123004031 [Tribolium madens]|uniref:uncharacterized protein LOC123004031 n=1 Tax=Tribolium madens TaxID=41895 RepID=UPI001CF744DF|nr:uncharacterized protein LOC123004031 [Tribolium madens]XP_044253072.1 uncharacterized protein LOC123004031 [Tribolium madens]